jgi:hypothetical protein
MVMLSENLDDGRDLGGGGGEDDADGLEHGAGLGPVFILLGDVG